MVVSVGDQRGLTIKNAAELRVRLLHLIERNGLKLKSGKVLPKGCGCSAVTPEDLDSWGCFSGCLSNYGVSVVEIILCGASCAAAGTGIGAIVCAICVGLNVTFVEFCALRCNMYAARMHDRAIPIRDNLKPIRSAHGSRRTKLTTSTVAVGS